MGPEARVGEERGVGNLMKTGYLGFGIQAKFSTEKQDRYIFSCYFGTRGNKQNLERQKSVIM